MSHSNISLYAANKILNVLLRNNSGAGAYTPPATVYLSLYNSNPGSDDSGVEVNPSGSAYARQAITFSAADDGVVTNSAVITFPTATANWGNLTHYGIHTASTAGDLITFGDLDPVREGTIGTEIRIPAGGIRIEFEVD